MSMSDPSVIGERSQAREQISRRSINSRRDYRAIIVQRHYGERYGGVTYSPRRGTISIRGNTSPREQVEAAYR